MCDNIIVAILRQCRPVDSSLGLIYMHLARAASLICPVTAVAVAPDFAAMYGNFRD